MRILKTLIIAAIKGYKILISPFTIRSCRYYPTCSEYAIEAIDRYGVVKGMLLGLKRILRCHPFSQGGFDPVTKSIKRG